MAPTSQREESASAFQCKATELLVEILDVLHFERVENNTALKRHFIERYETAPQRKLPSKLKRAPGRKLDSTLRRKLDSKLQWEPERRHSGRGFNFYFSLLGIDRRIFQNSPRANHITIVHIKKLRTELELIGCHSVIIPNELETSGLWYLQDIKKKIGTFEVVIAPQGKSSPLIDPIRHSLATYGWAAIVGSPDDCDELVEAVTKATGDDFTRYDAEDYRRPRGGQ
jgi:hypothetical protein